jgi:hypothetical protein
VREKQVANLSDTNDDSDELQEIFMTRKAREQAAERRTKGDHPNPCGNGETAQNQVATYQSDAPLAPLAILTTTTTKDLTRASHRSLNIKSGWVP